MTGTQAVRRAAANPWPERFARFGLATRGVLYLVIGILALRIALGHSDEKASQTGALQEIASKPGGRVLIWVVAVGLVGYALWRLASAAFGPAADPLATDGKQRGRAAAEGVGYGAIAVLALRIALGSGSSGSGGAKETATVLSWPGGQFLVGLVGVIIVVVGAFLVYEGWKADFTKELNLGKVGPTARKVVVELGRFGRVARGAAFAIIGVLVVVAAVQYDPDRARGLDGALKTLAAQPYGRWLLGLIALGFLAYGLYGLAESRLRKVG